MTDFTKDNMNKMINLVAKPENMGCLKDLHENIETYANLEKIELKISYVCNQECLDILNQMSKQINEFNKNERIQKLKKQMNLKDDSFTPDMRYMFKLFTIYMFHVNNKENNYYRLR